MTPTAREALLYEDAIKAAWEMVDVLRPPGQPGSYARGHHNGICDALHQLRANIETAQRVAARRVLAEQHDEAYAGSAADRDGSQRDTPSSRWRESGEPDPHGNRYDGERAELCMGNLTDDELANAVFMNYDRRPSIAEMMAGTAFMPIAYVTAAKDRIRWLSRKLEAANLAAAPEARCQSKPTAVDASAPDEVDAMIAHCNALADDLREPLDRPFAGNETYWKLVLSNLANHYGQAAALLLRERERRTQAEDAVRRLTDGQPFEHVVAAHAIANATQPLITRAEQAETRAAALAKELAAARPTGWSCPACGCVNAPSVSQCPCRGNKTLRERISTP